MNRAQGVFPLAFRIDLLSCLKGYQPQALSPRLDFQEIFFFFPEVFQLMEDAVVRFAVGSLAEQVFNQVQGVWSTN